MKDLKKQQRFEANVRKSFKVVSTIVVLMTATTLPVMADDATQAINNLTALVCNIVSAIGIMLALWGVVQFGLSFSSHDPSQKNTGLLQLVGGILVAIAPQLLKSILSGTSVDTSAIPVSAMVRNILFFFM